MAERKDATTGVAGQFTSTSGSYDQVVVHNIQGARRLVASIPDDRYRRVLDVGCGTGWGSLAMVDRFAPEEITGVDPSEGMLAQFREKVAGHPGTRFELRAEDVMAMGVPEGAHDAVISTMALHWFPDKPGAVAAMARALAPGGVMAILCSGRGAEDEFRDVLRGLDPPAPPEWDAAFDQVQRDIGELEEYLEAAGMEPQDVWMERRIRRTPPEAYLERMRVVAGHITPSLDDDERADLSRRLLAAINAVSGPRGFEYTFTKLFAIARRPSA